MQRSLSFRNLHFPRGCHSLPICLAWTWEEAEVEKIIEDKQVFINLMFAPNSLLNLDEIPPHPADPVAFTCRRNNWLVCPAPRGMQGELVHSVLPLYLALVHPDFRFYVHSALGFRCLLAPLLLFFNPLRFLSWFLVSFEPPLPSGASLRLGSRERFTTLCSLRHLVCNTLYLYLFIIGPVSS